MNLNSRVLFNNPPFIVKKTDDGRLHIKEGLSSEDVLKTLFTCMFFALFCFVKITSMEYYAPQEFFYSWWFFVVLFIAFMLLFYIWYKGAIVFDNAKGILTSKLYQNKFFGSMKIPYQDIDRITVNIEERINESDKSYLVYFFRLKLKSGDSRKLLTVFRKKHGRYIKTRITNHLGREVSETHHKQTPKTSIFKRK